MDQPGPTSDGDLLRRSDVEPEAFAVFYRRHLPAVLGFVVKRVESREAAADLTAEVFAAALQARATFDPDRGSARSWLCTIAANKIVDSARRGQVEDRARRELAMQPVAFEDADLERVDLIASNEGDLESVANLLGNLGADERLAVEQRVLAERPYDQIAADLGISESVVRKRVSRGLTRLRRQLEKSR
jgi:RNA polymerase sigma factor (sigma-70 family)